MNIRFTCRAVAFCGATLLFNCQAENTFVGKGISMNKEVISGTETQSDLMAIGPGTVHKTGPGTWKIPQSALMAGPEGKIVVHEGQIELTVGGTSPEVAEPNWLRSRVAMWLCADNNVIADGDKVSKWCDVRETNIDSPNYMYGKPKDDYVRGGLPVKTTFDGKNGVYFGGYGSGISLLYYDTDGTRHTETDVLHYYVVHAVKKNVGALFGISTSGGGSGSSGDFIYRNGNYDANYTNRWVNSYYISRSYDLDTQFYQNGVACDGATTAPTSNAWELVDIARAVNYERIDSLFRQYSQYMDPLPAFSSGGDYVAEVMLFTKRLTEPERVELEAYLMRKWGVDGKGTPSVALSENAVVRLDVSANTTAEIPRYTGEGVIVKNGAGTLVDRADGNTTVAPTPVALQTGDLATCGLVRLKAEAGTEVSVGPAGDCSANLATVAAAGDGEFVKSGSEAVEVSEIAANVTMLKVADGRLRLAGGSEMQDLVGVQNGDAPQEIALVNPSFETRPTDVSESGSYRIWWERTTDDEHLPGWRVKTTAWAAATGGDVFIWGKAGAKKIEDDYAVFIGNPPDGQAFCAFHRTAQISQEVELTRAGRYELALWVTGQKTEYRQRFILQLLDESSDDGSVKTNSFGQFYAPMNGAYARLKGACEIEKPGRYRLVIETQTNSGIVSAVDDIHLTYVPEGKLRRWLVPNGNFEDGAYAKWKSFNSGTTHPGWEFIPPTGYAGEWPAVTLAGFNMKRPDGLYDNQFVGTGVSTVPGANNNPLFQMRRAPEGGLAALAFLADGSRARTTFVPPAGTWKLKAVCAAYFGVSGAADVLAATVTKRGGAEQSLGFVSEFAQKGWPVERIWPIAFASDGETPITLELTFSPNASGGQLSVDDLELYEAPQDDETELVRNGGFEQVGPGTTTALPPADWKCLKNDMTEVTSYTTEGGVHLYDAISPDKWEGGRYMDLPAGWHVRQAVAVPAAGVYRLRFALHKRADANFDAKRWLPLVASVIDTEGVTNFTATIASVYNTNFVAHVYDFRIPAAGDYMLDIQSQNPGGEYLFMVQNCLDGVSLKRAPKMVRETAIPATAQVEVAVGAKLELTFTGTNTVSRIRLGGKYKSGLVTAETAPEYISGPGALYAEPRGMLLIVR